MASLLPSLLRKLRRRSAPIRTPRHSEMEKLEDPLLLAGNPAMIQQQHFAYLLNQARVDPRGAMDAWGLHSDLGEFESRPSLAISKPLHDAATARAAHLAGHGGLAGALPGRTAWPNATVRDQGYPLPQDWPDAANFVEIVATGNVIPDAHTLLGRLLGDNPTANATHRQQLLGQNAFLGSRELGLAVVHTDLPALRDFWTLEVARPETPTSFLTGVVFQDSNHNQQFDPGEGLAGVTVSVGVRQLRTNAAGGWNVAVEPGEHSIFVQGGQFFGTAQARVTVGEENVAVDFISGRSVGVVNFNRWQNGWNPHDVNADGRVNAFDVLLRTAVSSGRQPAGK